MSFRTLLSIGFFGTVLALSSTAQAITVNPAGGSYNFVWNDKIGGSNDIDGVCEASTLCDPMTGSVEKTWSIKVETKSNLEFFEVVDGYKPGDEFSLKINGVAVAWSDTFSVQKNHEKTQDLTAGYFKGVLSNFLMEKAGTYVFSLILSKTPSSCNLSLQVLTPCKIGRAFASFGITDAVTDSPDSPPDEPTAVPVPAALPLLATGLGILGFGAWRRRR